MKLKFIKNASILIFFIGLLTAHITSSNFGVMANNTFTSPLSDYPSDGEIELTHLLP